jgi:rSAM/selenodomain-associated transferase 2
MRPALGVVMPVLDEAGTLTARLRALQPLRRRGVLLVVVDGGSQDGTPAIAREHADLVLNAPRGRAAQMNAGAAACPAEVLLFLHADTALPDQADALVRRATRDPSAWGRFDVRIDSPRRALRLVEHMMNLRSRWTGIATGDQAMFVRRELFDQVGGFPDLPLMEDIALYSAARQHLGAALGAPWGVAHRAADVAPAPGLFSGRRSSPIGHSLWLQTTLTPIFKLAGCRWRSWRRRPLRAWRRRV